MRRRLRWFLLAALPLWLAGPASAGPWPRDDGAILLILSQERDTAGNGFTGLYAEYGLSPRDTLGLELGRNSFGDSSLLLWLQRGFSFGKLRFASSLGLGLSQQDTEFRPLAQLGLSLGRGFDTRFGAGWLAADTRFLVIARPVSETVRLNATNEVNYLYLAPETGVEADLTLGLKPRDGIMLIGQLRMEQPEKGDFAASASASVVRDLGRRAKVELGIVGPLTGEGEPSLKLAAWLSF